MTDGDYRTLALVSYTGLPTPVMVLLDDNACVLRQMVPLA